MDLRAYFRRALELEAAVYQQQKLVESLPDSLDRGAPKRPSQMRRPSEPKAPDGGSAKSVAIVGVVVTALLLVVAIVGFFVDKNTINLEASGDLFETLFLGLMKILFALMHLLRVPLLILAIVSAIGFVAFVKKEASADKAAAVAYQEALRKYERDMEQYRESQDEQRAYDRTLYAYNADKREIVAKQQELLGTLKSALEAHYALGVIFPKYRHLVAVAVISEYLESGRCSMLEGADGAYNLYEAELRQNIVIGQLSAVVKNLEQIRNNQYLLYSEIRQANNCVNELLENSRSISSTSALTAHYARMAALAVKKD